MDKYLTDEQLVALLARVAVGDDIALKNLYDNTSSRLFGLALGLVRQRQAAEDVLQDGYIAIWRTAATFDGSLSPPMCWMTMVIRSKALDALRRRKASRAEMMSELDEDTAAAIPASTGDPMEAGHHGQLAVALRSGLNRLRLEERKAIACAYFRGLSHVELASELGVPLGTAKTWIRRGLAQMRIEMQAFDGRHP